ncbi:MAG: hypothetical protein E6417_12415, partial [Bradyrhizobium sp.]|nr:hypothetical protein [Bradyrhizobium sp.]
NRREPTDPAINVGATRRAVIARLDRAIQYIGTVVIISMGRGVLDARLRGHGIRGMRLRRGAKARSAVPTISVSLSPLVGSRRFVRND